MQRNRMKRLTYIQTYNAHAEGAWLFTKTSSLAELVHKQKHFNTRGASYKQCLALEVCGLAKSHKNELEQ
eukprot:15421-Heterococcus_DN1.PRE.2